MVPWRTASERTVPWQAASELSRLRPKCLERPVRPDAQDGIFFFPVVLPLVNGFHDGVRAVLLSGWRPIAYSFSRQWLSQRFACCIAPRMAAHCSFFRSLTAFPTVYAPYCSADGSGLLILPLVNGFHDGVGLRADFLSAWQYIVRSSSRQRLFRQFARRIAQRMAVNCSFFRSLTSLMTVCTSYYSADGDRLHILSLVNGFHDGLRAVLLHGWQRIAHSSAR